MDPSLFATQPYALVLVARRNDLVITATGENAAAFCGRAPADLLGTTLSDLLPAAVVDELVSSLSETHPGVVALPPDAVGWPPGKHQLITHTFVEELVIEVEPRRIWPHSGDYAARLRDFTDELQAAPSVELLWLAALRLRKCADARGGCATADEAASPGDTAEVAAAWLRAGAAAFLHLCTPYCISWKLLTGTAASIATCHTSRFTSTCLFLCCSDPEHILCTASWPSDSENCLGRMHLTKPSCPAGFMLLRGEWKAAVSAILASRPGEPAEVSAARQLFLESGDASAAAAAMPRHMVAERSILQVRIGSCHQALLTMLTAGMPAESH